MLFNYWYWLPYESAVQSTLATALYWNCATVFFCDCLTAARPLSSQPRDSLFSNIKFEPLLFHTISYQCYIWYHLIHMCNSPMPPRNQGPSGPTLGADACKKRSQHEIHVPVESCYGHARHFLDLPWLCRRSAWQHSMTQAFRFENMWCCAAVHLLSCPAKSSTARTSSAALQSDQMHCNICLICFNSEVLKVAFAL